MGFNDFVDICGSDVAVPDGIGIDHDIGPVLALIEAAGFIGADFVLQPTLRELLLEDPLQLALSAGIAAPAGMPFRALIYAHEDVLVELWHVYTVMDGRVRVKLSDFGFVDSRCFQSATSPSPAGVEVGQARAHDNAGALRHKEPLFAVILETHEFRHRRCHRCQT